MAEIGATLREARMRAHIDVSEIEAQTKIRAKYLRALENEEWDLLPGPTFVKSFLRTYAEALGLDGKVLIEEYRLAYERSDDSDFRPIVSTAQRPNSQRAGRRTPSGSRSYKIAIGAFSLLIVVLVVELIAGGGGSKHKTAKTTPTITTSIAAKKRPGAGHGHIRSARSHSTRVSLSLRAIGAIYVCLIGDNEEKRIPGLELQAGEQTATYHARHFDLTLGNNAVTMYVNGKAMSVPPSGKPIGYSISESGRHTLSAGQLPTCK
jgi:cytoskeleton protein RodZ